MKIKTINTTSSWYGEEKFFDSFEDFLRDRIQENNYGLGELESIKCDLHSSIEVLAKFIELLVNKKLITKEEILKIIGNNYSDNKVEFIE